MCVLQCPICTFAEPEVSVRWLPLSFYVLFFKSVFYLARSLTTPTTTSLFQVVSKPLRSTFLCFSCKTTKLGFYVDAGIRIRSSNFHIKHFLHWAISFSPLWLSLISCCCDKTLWQKQLKGERFVQFTVSMSTESIMLFLSSLIIYFIYWFEYAEPALYLWTKLNDIYSLLFYP